MKNLLKGRGYKDRLFNPLDAIWDARLGVQTFGYHPETGNPGDDDWRVHYTPTPYSDIFRLLKLINLNDDDTFIDFGCGMGRSVFAASLMGAKRSIGVEIVPHLRDKAEENYRGSKLANKNIEFVNENADTYKADKATVIFMFHPFGEPTLRRVIDNIERDRTSGSTLRIIYINPIYDHVMAERSWLKQTNRLPAPKSMPISAPRYAASLWQSC